MIFVFLCPLCSFAEALIIAKLWGRCCQFGPYTKQVELHPQHVSPCPDTVQSALLLCIQHGTHVEAWKKYLPYKPSECHHVALLYLGHF